MERADCEGGLVTTKPAVVLSKDVESNKADRTNLKVIGLCAVADDGEDFESTNEKFISLYQYRVYTVRAHVNGMWSQTHVRLTMILATGGAGKTEISRPCAHAPLTSRKRVRQKALRTHRASRISRATHRNCRLQCPDRH